MKVVKRSGKLSPRASQTSSISGLDKRIKSRLSKAHCRYMQNHIESLEQQTSTQCGIQDDDNFSTVLDGPDLQEEQTWTSQIMLNTQSMSKDFGLSRIAHLPCQLTPSSPHSTKTSSSIAYRLHLISSNLSADEKGQLHYFGYTSNLQVASLLPVWTPPSSPSSDLQSEYDNAEDLADSKNAQYHLLELYFRYQHPALPILDEECFMADYARGVKTQYFSSFLLHAILLRSLRLDYQAVTPELADIYTQRVKSELVTELENPTIATVQALCIFGHYLGSLGNDRGCWLYPGMAFRLIYDLGLHQDCTKLTDTNCLTEKDRRVRHVTLWGCYISDKLYSLFHGRPPTLRLTDITVPNPTLETVGPQYSLLSAWVDLSTILNDIMLVINGPLESLEDNAILAKLSATNGKLLAWLRQLPASFQWDPKKTTLPSPGVCALHIQFLTTIILLHRPFTSYMAETTPKNAARKQLDGFSTVQSQQICTVNAIRVSKLLLAFKMQYGIEKIFSTVTYTGYTAALSLISEIVTDIDGEYKEEERKWLLECVRILRDLKPSSPVADRNLTILTSVLESCGYAELAQEGHVDMARSTDTEKQSRKDRDLEVTEISILDDRAGGKGDNENEVITTFDLEMADFFPQLMPQFNFGNWSPDLTINMEMVGEETALSRELGRGNVPDSIAEFPLYASYT
ncbi:fungal-specific transcription factor domain-containing protein [Xylogone sp. PMI_703]|nr:fungal-specific transcription factor domain-containing protein [Xylogone sp. PMI_703]